MAKRNYSRKGNKIQPAVQTLSFSIGSSDINGTHYLDLSQIASVVNRRFYRQGINWAVAGFRLNAQTVPDIASVTVSKLPNTWVMANAWEKSFRTWQKMNNEALAETQSVRPKFLDFKIYADATHHAAGFAANLMPWAAGGQFIPGEWEPSKIVYPDNTTATGLTREAEFVATGPNYPGPGFSGFNAVSLIEGYAASRGLPDILDPNVPGDADEAAGSFPQNWMAAIFNDGTDQTEEVLTDMITENNIAPYPFENDGVHVDTMYPGGANQGPGLQFHDQSFLTTTTVGGTTRLKGGNFPCGLIRLDVFGVASDTEIFIDLVPGNHRGYLCEPMTEM